MNNKTKLIVLNGIMIALVCITTMVIQIPIPMTEGYVNIKFFWGSSNYNTADMSRLIDGIISDCHELDIETMTPSEISRLKAAWGGD